MLGFSIVNHFLEQVLCFFVLEVISLPMFKTEKSFAKCRSTRDGEISLCLPYIFDFPHTTDVASLLLLLLLFIILDTSFAYPNMYKVSSNRSWKNVLW